MIIITPMARLNSWTVPTKTFPLGEIYLLWTWSMFTNVRFPFISFLWGKFYIHLNYSKIAAYCHMLVKRKLEDKMYFLCFALFGFDSFTQDIWNVSNVRKNEATYIWKLFNATTHHAEHLVWLQTIWKNDNNYMPSQLLTDELVP